MLPARDGKDGALLIFSELYRMCHLVEEWCGWQCNKGESNKNFPLEVGDKFVEVSTFFC